MFTAEEIAQQCGTPEKDARLQLQIFNNISIQLTQLNKTMDVSKQLTMANNKLKTQGEMFDKALAEADFLREKLKKYEG